MLYDVLPPLFLLASIGGIIVVVSRVTLRMKREVLATNIQAQAATITRQKAEKAIFEPGKKKVKLMGNRALQSISTLKSSATQTREAIAQRREERSSTRKERKEEKHRAKQQKKQDKSKAKANQEMEKMSPEKNIQQPTSSWRDRLSGITSRGKTKLASMQNVKERIANRAKEAEKDEETAQSAAAVRTSIQSIFKTKEKPQPLAVDDQADQVATKPAKEITMKRIITPTQESIEPALKKEDLAEPKRNRLLNKVRRKKEDIGATLEEARAALGAKQYQRAEDILLPYIVQHSKDANAYMLLCQVALAQSSWDEAYEICEQIERMNADQPGLKAAKGKAAFHTGKMTVALQTLQRAHDDDPENKDILRDLITIAQRMDNPALRESAQEQLSQIEAAKVDEKQAA